MRSIKKYKHICTLADKCTYESCGHKKPHSCKTSYTRERYCWNAAEKYGRDVRVKCIPTDILLEYKICGEQGIGACSAPGRCHYAKPWSSSSNTKEIRCPQDMKIKQLKTIDSDFLDNNAENEYLKRLGYI